MIDVERLARAIEREPEPVDIGCDETVRRNGVVRSCGRIAVSIVAWPDLPVLTHNYCRLHTTVELRHGRVVVRDLTQADHDTFSERRRERWLSRAQAIADRYAAGESA
jgi:hypothetical protein